VWLNHAGRSLKCTAVCQYANACISNARPSTPVVLTITTHTDSGKFFRILARFCTPKYVFEGGKWQRNIIVSTTLWSHQLQLAADMFCRTILTIKGHWMLAIDSTYLSLMTICIKM
jgi:hypothetical protein